MAQTEMAPDMLMFNQFSADKKPGMGVMEHVSDRSVYQGLSKIRDWRKMLSNEYTENLLIDNETWLSVEHYVLSNNYSDDAIQFVKLKNIQDVKELSKLKKKTYNEEALEKALKVKFSLDKYKSILIETKDAILTHWKRGMDVITKDNDERYVEPNSTCNLLMQIRSSIISENTKSLQEMEVHETKHSSLPQPSKEDDIQTINLQNNTDTSQDNQEVIVTNPQTNQLELKILSKKDFDDFNGFISKYNHQSNKSVNVLTKYEKTNIIGVRMEQLSMGCDTYISVDLANSLGCVKKIALAEFEQRKIPYIICRSMPNNMKEYWKLADLIYVE
jgi:DNA-directed RNA polymerase subunit K/omega